MGKAFCLFILAFLLVIYRQAIFGQKIVFSANYLASFYSPWSTQKFPGWDQGIPNKPIGADQFRFFYPNRTFSNQEITAGRIPLWNPYVFSGNPHLADFQSAIFYPLNILYLFLPQLCAWSILIIIQPFLAVLFCFLFLSVLPIKKLAAAFGAFAFGFSSYIITWSQEAMALGHSVIWLPLALFGIEKKKYWITILALTISILAGYLQTTIYISIFTVLYALFRQVPLKKIFIICLLSVGLCAIQIIPSLESFSLSARPTATIEKVFDTYLLPVTHLIKLIAPDINGNPGAGNYFGTGSYNETVLYIGLVPLIFAVYAFRKRGDPVVKFFLVATSLSFLLTSNFFLTRVFLHLPLPLIPTFQPSRILILTTFSLAVLSAFGLSSWLEEKNKGYKTIIVLCLLFSLALVLDLVFIKFNFLHRDWLVAAKNTALPFVTIGIFIVFIIARPLRRYLIFVALVLTTIGQFYFFNRYLVLGNKEFFYPSLPVIEYLQNKSQSFNRYLALGEPIYGDFATQLGIYSPEGYDPIFSKRYGQLLFATRDFMAGKLSEDIPRIEVMMSQTEKNPENFRRSRLLSLLGVKDILYATGQWQIVENKQALPRTFLVGNYVFEADPQKILDKIFDPNFDLSKTVVLEKNLPVKIFPGAGETRIISYQPNTVTIETSTDTPQLLFLSDNYYPGWKAAVDGKPTEIFISDYTFRSVAVPAGNHLVVFSYEPRSFEMGKYLTLGSLILLGAGKLLFSRNPGWGDKSSRKLERQ